jgi:hypothetical protein
MLKSSAYIGYCWEIVDKNWVAANQEIILEAHFNYW